MNKNLIDQENNIINNSFIQTTNNNYNLAITIIFTLFLIMLAIFL